MSVPLRTAVFGGILTAFMLAAFVWQGHQVGELSGEPYVNDFPTSGALNVMLGQGDGQAFYALATDPSLSRPEMFSGQTASTPVGAEAAYRAQRPLLGYVAWVVAAGQANLIPAALLFWAVVGGALLAGAVATYLEQRGSHRPQLALLVFVLPGTVQALSWLGPEPLGVGLAILGLAVLPRRPAVTVLCFVLAAFCRETLLLFPIGMGAWAVLYRRDLKKGFLFAVPVVVTLLWYPVVHWRYGQWPWAGGAGRSGPPFQGIIEAAPHLSVAAWLMIAVNAAMVIVVARYWRDPLAWVVAFHLAVAVCLGWDVWLNRSAFNRVLLPAQIVSIVLLLTEVRDPFALGRGLRGDTPSQPVEIGTTQA